MRSAKRIALAAAVASLIGSRPMVHSMCSDMVSGGLASPGVLERLFDERLDRALRRLEAGLSEPQVQQLRDFVESCKQRADAQWAALGTDSSDDSGREMGDSGRRPGSALVDDMQRTDPEMQLDEDPNELDPSKVQRGLLQIFDNFVVDKLAADFESAGRFNHVLRMNEIRDENQDHSWLWALGKRKQKVLPEEEFVVAVGLRLGADLLDDAVTCGYCHEQVLDVNGHHALVCAGSHATRGHTCLRDQAMSLALLADPAAEAEPAGIVPERPSLRPADILCATTHGQLEALDVGVTTPVPADGSHDAAERYKTAKLAKYHAYAETMRRQGIKYVPLIWTFWGRPHPDVLQTFKKMATKASRRRGLVSPTAILRETLRNCNLEIMARAGKMVLACIATANEDEDEE